MDISVCYVKLILDRTSVMRKIGIISVYLTLSAMLMALIMPATSVSAVCANTAPLGMRSWSAGLPCEGDVIKWTYGKGETQAANGLNQIIWTIVLNVIASVLALVGYVCVGMIIYGGYLYISSTGDSGKLERGKKVIFRTVIGLIIVLLARSIIEIFFNVISGNMEGI